MISSGSSRIFSTLRRLSAISGLFAAGIGILVLCGWFLDITAFKSIFSGLYAMNPLSAVCFILAGAVLWLLHRPQSGQMQEIAVRSGASTIIAFGLLRLLDYIGLWNLGIDQIVFAEQQAGHSMSRMAPLSAINFMCIGYAFLIFNRPEPKGGSPVQVLGLFVATASLLILVGYAFTLLSFNTAATGFIEMPLNTVLTFTIMGVGLLCAHPHRGIMATATANQPGSYMMRRVLPVVIWLPFLLGWLRVTGQNAGWFNLETGATLYTMSSIAIISAITWYTGKSLNRVDSRRQAAEEALISTNVQLRQTNIALKEANQLKTDILHIAAHDMKNPLGAIRTMAELIQTYPEDRETAQEMIPLIQSGADHMLKLIDELLRTAALDSGTLQLNREYIDLSGLVGLVIDSNSRQAQHKSQRIIMQIEPRCTVHGDFSRLREAIDNLVSNAVKYSPRDKNIYITLAQADGTARLEVRDEGPGLTGEDMKKLFGKFQRLHARPTANESSTGLGLSIVKQLVELHDGRVWAESKGEGMGASFYIELPAAQQSQPRDEQVLE